MAFNTQRACDADLSATLPAPRTILREFAHFLRRPSVLKPAGLRHRSTWAALGALATLHIGGLLFVLLPIISAWQRHLDLPSPDAFGQIAPNWLPVFTILAAPLLEEVIFRGWQTGRPRALWLLACFVLFAIAVYAVKAFTHTALIATLLVICLAALAGWWRLRRFKSPPLLYKKAYPVVFWGAALGFAALHLSNYPTTTLASLPMVLPQLWAAIWLGFTRQRIGLPAAMLQHAAANGVSMLLIQMGG